MISREARDLAESNRDLKTLGKIFSKVFTAKHKFSMSRYATRKKHIYLTTVWASALVLNKNDSPDKVVWNRNIKDNNSF